MKILFLCTAFNSLSQRLALVLKSRGHFVTVELALSPELMITAAELAAPDIIICPFLTKRVPPSIYNQWLTLIVHPGPPGDAGPSALDWTLIGDMGECEKAEEELTLINATHQSATTRPQMRSHWGVTVLQAIEALDAGPVWAFDQFKLDEHNGQMSKSELYRGPVTRVSVNAVLSAIEIIKIVATQKNGKQIYSVDLQAPHFTRECCVSKGLPFQGGKLHDRPLLKASSRDFFQLNRDGQHPLKAETIVQRIRCGDSQPGVMTGLFGTSLFVYNAVVQKDPLPSRMVERAKAGGIGTILATRTGAVLVEVGADYPIWICQLRRPKSKADKYLHPKLPAIMALMSMPEHANPLGLLTEVEEWSLSEGEGVDHALPWKRREGTYQQVWVELDSFRSDGFQIAYVHSEFYNGAFSTSQCEELLKAIQWTLAQLGLKAIVMLGGTGYFSNGIALNVIEGSSDPSAEGWANINAIDDCVQALLAPTGVVTFAAIRGNAAAGGLALATAADVVLCAESAVLNPHYRGIGLYGSEWHTYSWYERCGADVASKFARDMLPISSEEACKIGLVDYVINNDKMNSDELVASIKLIVKKVMTSTTASRDQQIGAPWTRPLRPILGQDQIPLSESMLRNKAKFLAYTFAGSGEDHLSLENHFQKYRKRELDQMTLDFFHPHRNARFAKRCTAFVRKLVPSSTPLRFALHRRHKSGTWNESINEPLHRDEEELDEFDGLSGIPVDAAIPRLPSCKPEFISRSIPEQAPKTEIQQVDECISTRSSVSAASTRSASSLSRLPSECSGPDTPSTDSALTPALGRMESLTKLNKSGVNFVNVQDTESPLPSPFSDLNDVSPGSSYLRLHQDSRISNGEVSQTVPILWSCYYSESGTR